MIVKRLTTSWLPVHMLCMFIFALSFGTMVVSAQLVYHIEHEWVRIWINQDGTIDLLYDIQISADAGTLHWVEISQPSGDFTIGQAFDEYGNELSAVDTSSQGNYKVRVDIVNLQAGESVQFNLTTNVGRMIWEDTENPCNVRMQFTPTWFPVTIDSLRVLIILPPGVTEAEVRTPTGMEWDSAYYIDGNFAVYWERANLAPNQKYTFGVSFPKGFVQQYESLLGDLNLDMVVDVLDAVQAASALGSYPRHPRWNSAADLNQDGVVDIFDVVILAAHFGESW